MRVIQVFFLENSSIENDGKQKFSVLYIVVFLQTVGFIQTVKQNLLLLATFSGDFSQMDCFLQELLKKKVMQLKKPCTLKKH